MALSQEQLDKEYRAALRREAHWRKRALQLEEVLLRMKGKLLADVQEIDYETQQLARESERHAASLDVQQLNVTELPR